MKPIMIVVIGHIGGLGDHTVECLSDDLLPESFEEEALEHDVQYPYAPYTWACIKPIMFAIWVWPRLHLRMTGLDTPYHK